MNLVKSLIKNATIKDVNFQKTNIVEADLTGSKISKSAFYGVDMRETNLSEVTLQDCTFESSDLSGKRRKLHKGRFYARHY